MDPAGPLDRGALAKLLAAQFSVLDDGSPVQPSAVQDGDTVTFAFRWPLSPGDRILAASDHRDHVAEFRSDFLAIIAPALAELVELELHREVTESLPRVGDDLLEVTFSFALGPARNEGRETSEALFNWCRQIRRHARTQSLRYRRRRQELVQLREEVAARRSG